MSTLQYVEQLTRFNTRPLSRAYSMRKKRLQRLMKLAIRKSRSATTSWYRRQYFITNAYKDVRKGIRLNEDIFLGAVITAAVLLYAFISISAELTYSFFITAFLFSEQSGANMIAWTGVAGACLAVLTAWMLVLIFNSSSLAIIQGLNRKKDRSLRQTFRTSLKLVGRVTTAWIILFSIMALPVLATIAIGINHLLLDMPSNLYELLDIAPYYTTAAVAGMLGMLVQYSLVPAVALFEPQLSYNSVLKRSQQLVSQRGRLFLLAGYGLLALSFASLAGLALVLQKVGLPTAMTLTLGGLGLVGLWQSILTVFYRKRRLARK